MISSLVVTRHAKWSDTPEQLGEILPDGRQKILPFLIPYQR